MFTLQVELPECNMALAFADAKQEAYNEIYHWDFTVALLNVVMLVDDDKHSFVFNFQVTKG